MEKKTICQHLANDDVGFQHEDPMEGTSQPDPEGVTREEFNKLANDLNVEL